MMAASGSTALNSMPPINRLGLSEDNLLRLHSWSMQNHFLALSARARDRWHSSCQHRLVIA
jgi:hypothetical protein